MDLYINRGPFSFEIEGALYEFTWDSMIKKTGGITNLTEDVHIRIVPPLSILTKFSKIKKFDYEGIGGIDFIPVNTYFGTEYVPMHLLESCSFAADPYGTYSENELVVYDSFRGELIMCESFPNDYRGIINILEDYTSKTAGYPADVLFGTDIFSRRLLRSPGDVKFNFE